MNHEPLKKKLVDEKALLIRELKEIGVVKDQKNPDDWQAKPEDLDILEADSNEVADRIGSYENNTALVNELEQRLAEIDTALTNMDEGKFGICNVCGKHIEEDRLSANPAAKTCKTHMNS
jgi:RNA polymerase-binding transcription factor DksA